MAKALAQAPYSVSAEETISRIGREVAETSLKFISWSVMIGALEFAATKSNNKYLQEIVFAIKAILWMFLFYSVKRIEIALFRPALRPKSLSVRLILMCLNLAVVTGLFWAGLFISMSVINAIMDLQTR